MESPVSDLLRMPAGRAKGRLGTTITIICVATGAGSFLDLPIGDDLRPGLDLPASRLAAALGGDDKMEHELRAGNEAKAHIQNGRRLPLAA